MFYILHSKVFDTSNVSQDIKVFISSKHAYRFDILHSEVLQLSIRVWKRYDPCNCRTLSCTLLRLNPKIWDMLCAHPVHTPPTPLHPRWIPYAVHHPSDISLLHGIYYIFVLLSMFHGDNASLLIFPICGGTIYYFTLCHSYIPSSLACIYTREWLVFTGLTGIDLLVADLKALEAYLNYFYYLTKMWTKPLPDVYDPQEVADYFNCRPHLVALRLLEVVKFCLIYHCDYEFV